VNIYSDKKYGDLLSDYVFMNSFKGRAVCNFQKNIWSIRKIHVVVSDSPLCMIVGPWSMKSQIHGIFIGVGRAKLILERPQIFFQNYIQLYP